MARATMPIFSPSCGSTSTMTGFDSATDSHPMDAMPCLVCGNRGPCHSARPELKHRRPTKLSDELADRIRAVIGGHPHGGEIRMFGGTAHATNMPTVCFC